MNQPGSRSLGGILLLVFVAKLAAAGAAQEKKTQKPQGQKPGAGKVLGLPMPKADRERRNKRLVLPPRLQSPGRQETRTEADDESPAGALSDFVDSLISGKRLATAELVAEYALLTDSERRVLMARAHRLPAKAVGRLAGVYRALPPKEADAAALSLLTVLRSRKIGKETRKVVEHALFLSGPRAKQVALGLLTCKYKGVRDAAGDMLTRLLGESDLPQLRLLIDHEAQGTRLVALRVLADWLADNPGADPKPLLRCLRHRDGTTRTQAARYLMAHGPAIEPVLQQMVSGPPEDSSFFLAALLLAQREVLTNRELLPPSCLHHLARYRFGLDVMPRGVAFLVASMRWFRDPAAFRKSGGALATVDEQELFHELLSIVEVRGFYPEFPLCQDAALSSLRLLSGKDFGADHVRWRAWWRDAGKSFRPLQRNFDVSDASLARTRLTYLVGDRAEFVVMGRLAQEPPSQLGGFRLRLDDADLRALLAGLRERGFLDLEQRLNEVKKLAERLALLVESPEARALDGFATTRSLRLRVFLDTLDRTLRRESWQEYVPHGLDEAGRREWWNTERVALAASKDAAARRRAVLGLALRALPSLPPDARRRAIGRFLDEAGREEGTLNAGHAAALLALLNGSKLQPAEKATVFEVLALIKESSFREVLGALVKHAPHELRDILRRMLALAGTERVLVALRHEHPKIRALAAEEVAHLGNTRTIPALLACLDDADFEVRSSAAESCGRLRLMQARPTILKLLADPEVLVRQAAMLALARIGGGDTYEILLRAAGPGNAAERLTATQGLSLLQEPRAGHALVDLAAAHYGTPVGMMALQGLRKRGSAPLRAKLWKVLQSSDNPALRREFTFLLGEMGDPGVFQPLLRLLAAGDSTTRSCTLLAGITGRDWCGRRDCVKRYRDWWVAHGSKSAAAWLLSALQESGFRSSLDVASLRIGAGVDVVDELCRIIDDSEERLWAVRALATNVLRDVTQQDFGTIHQRTSLGARHAITERYRQFVRARDAGK